MKNIGTKSVNMSDKMVYLAMFSTTIDKISCFWVKMSHYFISLWYPLEVGTFLISEDPPLILNFSQLKFGIFLIFWTVSQISPLFSLESFPNLSYVRQFKNTSPSSASSRPISMRAKMLSTNSDMQK